ncbi:MAG: bifunctional glutamate N-acetyltransferase/amino-acid acetyltransferase ArgJ [Proteobacteria bacterium]|nr:bifunctional glutamate N-acetyltransferase/amino-acid acetyltransferase ArgJ [Pseudomonadota bacterium]MDA1023351.1 bifunctional glutamate N-acetyltransferase/amino-acid acetyltransferase ArgJ [Pseudomonadota bacterium]
MCAKPSSSPVSPLAPKTFPDMPEIPGVRVAATCAGLKKSGKIDLLLVEMAPETCAAGVFTRSLTASAPVRWCRKALKGGPGGAQAQGLVVNSENANTFTGPAGEQAVERIVEAVADLLSCRPSRVFTASTGVIGKPLDDGKIIAALPALQEALAPDAWDMAARAIMTTDTFPKAATRTAEIGGVQVTINGISKGSGMIHPDMATMLAYVFTDATLPADVLQELLEVVVDKSFNAITVDSDTSTSDSLMLFATGAGKSHPQVRAFDDAALDDFKAQLLDLCIDLAHQIVRDGEGATKFLTITVDGAETDAAAKRIALTIATSPLVKTAVAGEDANWGRIVMAVGKAGQQVDTDKLAISIGGVAIAEDGGLLPGYDETPVALHMKGQEIDFHVDVGIADGTATVWTCDLTHGYIEINADYRS